MDWGLGLEMGWSRDEGGRIRGAMNAVGPHPYSCDTPRKSPAASVDGFLSVTAHPQDLFYSKHL